MPTISSYSDYQPITWFRRMPIYFTTILIALFVAGMACTVILQTARVDVMPFVFDPYAFWKGHKLWQIVTYPLLSSPSFFFLFGLFCFYWFGSDVERYLGRTRYLKLIALLVLTPPLMLTAWWLAAGMPSNMEFGYGGSVEITIGMFVAFATLYPNLEYWGWVTMKWLVFAGIVLSALNYLPNHNWPGLSVLLATCGVGFGFVRLLQHGGSVEFASYFGRMFKKRPKLRVVRSSAPVRAAVPARSRAKPEEKDVIESIDPLLDKISEHGLASLTAREREKLERVRTALLKKSSD